MRYTLITIFRFYALIVRASWVRARARGLELYSVLCVERYSVLSEEFVRLSCIWSCPNFSYSSTVVDSSSHSQIFWPLNLFSLGSVPQGQKLW